MCTLAWETRGNSLWACFNRDEQRTRAEAEPPALHDSPSGPVIHAKDPDGNGTWFSASTNGFAVALLNFYPEEGPQSSKGSRSRGLLVKDLAGLPSPQAAIAAMETNLSLYSPFHLFILSIAEVAGFSWDGRARTTMNPVPNFWTTSSHIGEAIGNWRLREWADKVTTSVDAGQAAAVLRERNPERPAFGFTMDRDDARTHSQIILNMGGDGLSFHYRAREAEGIGYNEPVTVSYQSP